MVKWNKRERDRKKKGKSIFNPELYLLDKQVIFPLGNLKFGDFWNPKNVLTEHFCAKHTEQDMKKKNLNYALYEKLLSKAWFHGPP